MMRGSGRGSRRIWRRTAGSCWRRTIWRWRWGARTFQLTGDSGGTATFSFCPSCGVTVAYVNGGYPELEGFIAIPVGTFAEVDFPAPWVEVYEERRCPWVELAVDGERMD